MSEQQDTSGPRQQNTPGFQPAIDHMLGNKVEALLWLTRIGTVLFTLFTVVPIFGFRPYSSYIRALLCTASTSALRLHQRMPRVHISRELWVRLLIEDSFHKLMYSLLFIFSYPITLALFPIALFSALHSVNYSLIILNKLGFEDTWLNSFLTSIIEHHQRNLLQCVAFSEVCLFPLIVFHTICGGSLIVPCVYYNFLRFRYASRRNPYTRTVFHMLRIYIEEFANTPGRSHTIRDICHRIITAVCWLSPPVPVQS